MLDNMRNFGRSWVAKLFFGVLIIAVAGFGIPSVFLDLNANTVARVGDQNISVREFDGVYRAQLSQFAQQTGMTPTAQEAVNFGIPNAAIARLANEASATELGRRFGLGVSDAKLASLVRQDPSFAGALGLFDSSEFSMMLRQSGYTEAEYLNLQRDIARREQIALVFEGARLPRVALDIAKAYENDLRTIVYSELNPMLFQVTEDPTDEQLTQFFEENQQRFRTVETRLVNVLPLTPDALAGGIEVTGEQIAAEYERTAAQYVTNETRAIHQVPVTEEQAALFQTGLDSGSSFASVVSGAGLQTDVTELGTLSQAEITDPALAETAFGLQEGGYALLDGAQGQRVIWVSAVQEGGQQPLESVRDQVARAVQLDQARDMLLDVYDEIEEARAAFQPIADVAERYGLEIHELELTSDGAALAQIPSLPEGSAQQITQAIFNASDEARVTPAINLGSNRTVFFELEEVRPARDQTLDEVRDEVVAAWQELQSEMRMTRTAEEMVAAIDSGSDIYDVAMQRNLVAETSGTFTRNTPNAGIGPDLAQAAFQGGEGYANYVTTQDGSVIVFEVTDVIPASVEGDSQVAQTLQTSFPNLLYSSFIEALRQDVGVRINQDALNRVIGLE